MMMKKSATFSLASSSESESEEREEVLEEEPPPTWSSVINAVVGNINRKRLLSKQLSMRETSREAKWEKRRRQIVQRRRMMMMMAEEEGGDQDLEEEKEEELEEEEMGSGEGGRRRRRMLSVKGRVRSLTDEDLDELRGSIELGFGFNEEDGGHNLCGTLPALDLYFAVNRQLSDPKIRSSPSPSSTPTATSSSCTLCSCGTPSPRSPNEQQQPDSWKICNPGDNPQHVKTRLRHWAQAVACSVRQCC